MPALQQQLPDRVGTRNRRTLADSPITDDLAEIFGTRLRAGRARHVAKVLLVRPPSRALGGNCAARGNSIRGRADVGPMEHSRRLPEWGYSLDMIRGGGTLLATVTDVTKSRWGKSIDQKTILIQRI